MTRQEIHDRVRDWNGLVAVTDRVAYVRDDGQRVAVRTRARAQVLGDLTPAVWLDGVCGSVSLDRVAALIHGIDPVGPSEKSRTSADPS